MLNDIACWQMIWLIGKKYGSMVKDIFTKCMEDSG